MPPRRVLLARNLDGGIDRIDPAGFSESRMASGVLDGTQACASISIAFGCSACAIRPPGPMPRLAG
jgi:hypothetical protein